MYVCVLDENNEALRGFIGEARGKARERETIQVAATMATKDPRVTNQCLTQFQAKWPALIPSHRQPTKLLRDQD